MTIPASRFVTILFVALMLGLAFAHALEMPAKLRCSSDLYVTLQKSLYVAWGPPNAGGFLEPIGVLATIVLAYLVRRRRAAFRFTAASRVLQLLSFPVVVFFALIEPSNAAFRSSSPQLPPENREHLRTSRSAAIRNDAGHATRCQLAQCASMISPAR